MMDSALEAKLIDCLDALEVGESIESILARYPDDASRLRPSLELAAALPTMRREPSEIAEAQARRQFLAQAESLRQASPSRPGRWLGSLAAVAAVVLVVGVGLVGLSGTALPGGPLYGLKRGIEEVRLSLAPNDSARETLDRRIKQTRRDEVTALLSAPRDLDIAVVFEGVVEAMDPGQWRVSGILLTIDPSTQIDGNPAVDDEVQVNARLTAGALHAQSIRILAQSQDTPPARSPQIPTATPTPQSEETLLEPIASPSDTPTPTLELSPIPPTLVPLVPNQDANDNGDDGDNSDANDNGDNGDDGSEIEDGDNSNENEGEEDNSGPGGGEDDGDNSGSSSDDDNSGSGSSSDDDGDDNSGSGGGSDGDNSGSGGGSDEEHDD